MRTLALLVLLAATAYAEHPLQPLVTLGEHRLKRFNTEVQDYTCKVVKRETIRGILQPMECMYAKIRPEPFAIYVRYLHPKRVYERELLFVENQYLNKIIVKKGGPRFAFITTSVEIDSDVVKVSSNYSIKDMGFARLLKQMIEIAKEEMQSEYVEVKYYEGVKIEGRSNTMAQIRRTQKRDSKYDFQIARLYIDDEMQLPTRLESWGWPDAKGITSLLEEFTLLEVHFNQGLTDQDFDYKSPQYGFNANYETHLPD